MKMKWEKRKKEEIKNCGELYSSLVDQIEGLLDIEIGNYIYEETNDKLSIHINRYLNGGLDIYIYDQDFCILNDFDMIDFNQDINNIDDILMIEHLHYEDILWFIMNFKEEKKEMIKRIDRYIEWKEKYNEENKK